tara:strand:- start:348 stop:1064 length:717 start_codon:yes stop_codon:yes gene_type:complete
MEGFYYINVRGTIIQILKTHPICYIEDSLICNALKWDDFSEKNPFYIDIDPNSFHTILSYLNCHYEATNDDKQAETYVKLLEKNLDTNPLILYSMNKLAICDNMSNKILWSCSLDNRLDITKSWDKVSGFIYIINMLCENTYKNIYSCINKLGHDESKKTLLKESFPLLEIRICNISTNNIINLDLGYQKNDDFIQKKQVYTIDNYINKFSNISDFSDLFKDVKKLMPGCENIDKRYI